MDIADMKNGFQQLIAALDTINANIAMFPMLMAVAPESDRAALLDMGKSLVTKFGEVYETSKKTLAEMQATFGTKSGDPNEGT